MNKPNLIFTQKASGIILKAFGKYAQDGIIYDSETDEPVLTPDGEELKVSEFGAMKKGSEIFLKDDLYSIMQIAEGKI